MEPHLSFLLLEFYVGIEGVGKLLAAVLRRGVQIAVILKGRPFRLGTGISVGVFVVRTDCCLDILDAGRVVIHTQLSGRRESLVQG